MVDSGDRPEGPSPHAREPIDQVVADAADLVEIQHTLRQLVNVMVDQERIDNSEKFGMLERGIPKPVG